MVQRKTKTAPKKAAPARAAETQAAPQAAAVKPAPVQNETPRIAEVDEKVAKALKALDEYAKFDQEKIDYIVAKCSVAALDQHGVLAKLAVEETGRGVFEDKATKNLFACEYVVNNMRNMKTVGIISDDPVTGNSGSC